MGRERRQSKGVTVVMSLTTRWRGRERPFYTTLLGNGMHEEERQEMNLEIQIGVKIGSGLI